MKLRMNYITANPAALKALLALEQFNADAGIETSLYELIKLRASLLNGCAYCVDMHSKDILAMGEPVERVYLLSVWRDTTIYSDKEKAALELTEAVTQLSHGGVPQSLYEKVRAHYTEEEFVNLIMAIITINAWNRIAISTGMFPDCF